MHERGEPGDPHAVWLAQEGRERDFIFVFLPGGPGRDQAERDFGHFGFAPDSRAAVDAVADRAREAGCLVWESRAAQSVIETARAGGRIPATARAGNPGAAYSPGPARRRRRKRS